MPPTRTRTFKAKVNITSTNTTTKPTKPTASQPSSIITTTTTKPANPQTKKAGTVVVVVTPFQEKVYTLLTQIPAGRVTTYGCLARALETSARAVGNALRHNPFAPEVPCHRVIASNGHVGGFRGEWYRAPSGVNQRRKLSLLAGEGVRFDAEGFLVVHGEKKKEIGDGVMVDMAMSAGEWEKEGVLFDGPWDLSDRAKRTTRNT